MAKCTNPIFWIERIVNHQSLGSTALALVGSEDKNQTKRHTNEIGVEPSILGAEKMTLRSIALEAHDLATRSRAWRMGCSNGQVCCKLLRVVPGIGQGT